MRAVRAHGGIKRIYFSDNSLSELNQKNQLQKALFVYELGYFLEDNDVVESVNLQGLLLGKLILYLVPFIKSCDNLKYLNISTNLLGNLDKDLILKELKVEINSKQDLGNSRELHDVVF